MCNSNNEFRCDRRGTLAILGGALMVAMLGLAAFSVDYGYLLKVRTDMQRIADAAALAATQDLIPDDNGNQNLTAVRAAVRSSVAGNVDDPSFQVANADIEIGRYDPDTIYSGVTLRNTGIFDTVRVTLRRDGNVNPNVTLFFARILGTDTTAVTATSTAVLQKAMLLEPGADVMPFSIPLDVWQGKAPGEQWSIYGDGRLEDPIGNPIPGNWGTVDIGATINATSDINTQILNGLRQSDLDHLYSDSRIGQNTHIDAEDTFWANADPGMSSGMKHGVEPVHGEMRIVPIYDQLNTDEDDDDGNGNGNGNGNGSNSGGNNLEYRIVRWGVVKIIDSSWNGNNANTYVEVQKNYMYSGELRAKNDLSAPAKIDGAYTSPVLVK